MTDSGTWTARGARGKVHVVVKKRNKSLFKSLQESVSCIPLSLDGLAAVLAAASCDLSSLLFKIENWSISGVATEKIT